MLVQERGMTFGTIDNLVSSRTRPLFVSAQSPAITKVANHLYE